MKENNNRKIVNEENGVTVIKMEGVAADDDDVRMMKHKMMNQLRSQ